MFVVFSTVLLLFFLLAFDYLSLLKLFTFFDGCDCMVFHRLFSGLSWIMNHECKMRKSMLSKSFQMATNFFFTCCNWRLRTSLHHFIHFNYAHNQINIIFIEQVAILLHLMAICVIWLWSSSKIACIYLLRCFRKDFAASLE